MNERELHDWATMMHACATVISIVQYERPDVVHPLPYNEFVQQTIRCAYGDTDAAIKN
jgi:hypothetical protein